jgi:hypothetical protein
MMEAELFDGTVLEFPDGTSPEVIQRVVKKQTAERRGSASTATAESPAAAPAEPTWTDTLLGGLDYADDTGAIALNGVRRGAAKLIGLPVDAVNAGMGLAGLPVSDKPVMGGEWVDEIFGAPAAVGSALTGIPDEVEPKDALQRVVGRVGQEIGATAVPVGGLIAKGAQLGVQGARELGPLGRYFVEPAAVAPARLAAKEGTMAVAAGTGAGVANEIAGNPQEGDNFWSDLFGSLGGVTAAGIGGAAAGAGRNALAAITKSPAMMDDVAGEAVASRLLASSTEAGSQVAQTGQIDTAPIVRQLRTPSEAERMVPGYQANIGDRTQDPALMTLAQNQDSLKPGPANMRRVGNENAVNAQMERMAPAGDPAQFRTALEADRDAQIAEAIGAETDARGILDEATQAVQPGMPEASARGSSVRAGLQDAYDAVREYVSRQFEPINNATEQVPVGPLAERFSAIDEALPMNDRARFRPSEAEIPASLAPPQQTAPVPTGLLDASGAPITRAPQPVDDLVPLNEATSVRSGLTQDLMAQRGREPAAARVTQQYRDELDRYIEETISPELRGQYETARAARRDQGDRFERSGTAVAETLRPREGGGYQLDDSAVARRFAQPDSGRLGDLRDVLREAGTDARVRNGLADEVLADVQSRGLVDRPEALGRYLEERGVLMGQFPELRDRLQRAGAASTYASDVSAARGAAEGRLNTPGRSPQASYLKYGDEATVDAIRNLTSGAKPREAARELISAAGGSPEARLNARSALWEAVKTKKLAAAGTTGNDRWDVKKLKSFLNDPKVSAVAEEFYADAPEELSNIREVFSALAGAEGSLRARQPGSSGTPQAMAGKYEPALSAASVASRFRSVNRGVLSPQIALIDVAATYLRNRSAQVQSRAIDELTSTVVNNPNLAADLLEAYNPADYAAKRRMITQKYGARATQVLNLLDEAHDDDEEVREAATSEGPKPLEAGNIDLANRPVVKNDDGSISTVRSMSINEDGREILIPTVSPSGTVLTDEGAVALYRNTGKHLGKFASVEDADQFAEWLHQQQEEMYAGDTNGPLRVDVRKAQGRD